MTALYSADGSSLRPVGSVHALWWYESPDHRAAVRHEAHEDARVVAAGTLFRIAAVSYVI
jgi:hypothetical protein